ncbi:MarR family winged helix-turn-helix transcriptional regulator [Leucobacter chromiireducens]|uniref:MarR family winged helix-turn-helix transcriptional regulator n=1 Tax=Leucobacter chromiireducens TaxID=283877 RepID=UPI000F62E535|nr:MarR family winged helix-turn-helix transcriptional regulator [Leucobacter chromiireducens]
MKDAERDAPGYDRDWERHSLSDDLSFLLARANALSLAAGNAALRPFGLRVRSYPVLALVCDGLRPTQRELADFLRLDPSQVVALIDGLEGRGLLERRPDPRDRRSKVLVATAEGHRLYEAAHAAVLSADGDPAAQLTPAERETLTGLLRRVAFGPPRPAD